LRPETFFTWRALTSRTSNPRSSRTSKAGIQYTPVDPITTVRIPIATSQFAIRSKSPVKQE